MQIILQQDVDKLGTRGEVLEVKEGYARNYLLPRKLALEASPTNMKRLEKMRAVFAKHEATEKEAAEKLASMLERAFAHHAAQVRRARSTVRLRHFRGRRRRHRRARLRGG